MISIGFMMVKCDLTYKRQRQLHRRLGAATHWHVLLHDGGLLAADTERKETLVECGEIRAVLRAGILAKLDAIQWTRRDSDTHNGMGAEFRERLLLHNTMTASIYPYSAVGMDQSVAEPHCRIMKYYHSVC